MTTKRNLHLVTALVILLTLAFLAIPTAAQEAATGPADSLPLWVGYIVGGVILAVFAFAAWVQHTSNERVKTMTDTLTVAIQELSKSTPAMIREPGQEIIEGGLRSAADYVETNVTQRTVTPLDDELLDEAERRTLNLLRKLGLVSGDVVYNADPSANKTYTTQPPTFGQFGDDDDTGPLGKLAGLDSGK